MKELQRLIIEEQPAILAVLEKYIHELPVLAKPIAEHILLAGGKRLRPLLTLLFGRMFGCRHEDLYTLGAAVEMLHAATLLHDDVLDNAVVRRSRKAAHTIFGTTQAILGGDALLAKTLLMVAQLHDTRLTECLSEAVMETAAGELAEFVHLYDVNISQDEYLAVITGKTAWMLKASCQIGALRARATDEQVELAGHFGLNLGVAFQVIDDALDFSPSSETGKPTGGDLREGKITPPFLLYLQSLPQQQAQQLAEKFSQKKYSEEALEALGMAIYSGGFAEATRELAMKHLKDAAVVLHSLPECPERDLLESIMAYVKERKH